MPKGFEFTTKAVCRAWLIKMHDNVVAKPGAANIFDEPDRIFNADETGFQIGESGQLKIFAKKGKKKVSVRKSGDREMITCLCTGNAAGRMAPYFIVCKGTTERPTPQQMDMAQMPENAYRCTPTGWMRRELMEDYVIHFDNWLDQVSRERGSKIRKPVLLIIDGASCHMSAMGATAARERNIIVWTLPPHSTSNMQPMDISYNEPLKASFKKHITRYTQKYPNEVVKKNRFVAVLKKATTEVNGKPENLQSGFRSAGLYPFNPAIHHDPSHKERFFERPSTTTVEEHKEDQHRAKISEEVGDVEYISYGKCPKVFPQPETVAAGVYVLRAKLIVNFDGGKTKVEKRYNETEYKDLITLRDDGTGMKCRRIPGTFIRPENHLTHHLTSAELKCILSNGEATRSEITREEYIAAIGRPEIHEVNNF